MTIFLAGTFSGRGGIQTHLFWLSRALLEAGHRVRMASLGPSLRTEDEARVNELRLQGDFSFVCPQAAAGSGLKAAFSSLKNLVDDLRQTKPDVYVACGTGWNLFLPAILSGCTRRVFHEVMSGDSNGSSDSRHAVRFGFHQVIAQAAPVSVTFRRSFHWSKEVPVLPAFPEPLEITASIPCISQRKREMGTIRAAFFSRLVPHKGALWLVQQWPLLETSLAELHIYGSGPEEQAIKDLIHDKGWQDRVFCHGPYPDGQAYADLLSSYDLTLLPTLGAEGAPLVLLESMACGVPFVAYGVGGIPDYANADCIIVETPPSGGFVQAVRDAAVRLSEGSLDQPRLQHHYMASFSYARLAERWLEFLSAQVR